MVGSLLSTKSNPKLPERACDGNQHNQCAGRVGVIPSWLSLSHVWWAELRCPLTSGRCAALEGLGLMLACAGGSGMGPLGCELGGFWGNTKPILSPLPPGDPGHTACSVHPQGTHPGSRGQREGLWGSDTDTPTWSPGRERFIKIQPQSNNRGKQTQEAWSTSRLAHARRGR